jgi:hypothetical protein
MTETETRKSETGAAREKRGEKKRPRDDADGDETVAEMTVDDVIDENSPDDKPSVGPSSVSLAESVARALEPSLCVARCDIASVALADGVYSRSFEGNGLVLHHDPFGSGIGLVAVDRNTVPISSCDVLLTFAAYPHEIAGAVEFLHPTKNFALVSYDAKTNAL